MTDKKAPKAKSTNKSKLSPDSTAAVDAFMESLEHPHHSALEALRKIIRAANPSIQEGIKWNAPSFRTTEYFATLHLKAKSGLAVILHLGAKARPDAKPEIKDPDEILKWLGKDRAVASFAGAADVKKSAKAFTGILAQWIQHV
jgi:hypothetical protein